MEPETIPQRELRNQIGRVLLTVQEKGAAYRVTVAGRPVALLSPIEPRQTWVNRPLVVEILEGHPLDRAFTADVERVDLGTIGESFK